MDKNIRAIYAVALHQIMYNYVLILVTRYQLQGPGYVAQRATCPVPNILHFGDDGPLGHVLRERLRGRYGHALHLNIGNDLRLNITS